jgi:nitroreductase
MEIIEAINARYSVRAFKPDPVPKHILEELLTVAQRSPSWANTQTWEFAVAGGEVVEDLRKTLAARAFAQDERNADIPYPPVCNFVHRRLNIIFLCRIENPPYTAPPAGAFQYEKS